MDPVRYIDTIINSLDPEIQERARTQLEGRDEEGRESLITSLKTRRYPTSKLRYRPAHALKQDSLIKLIFDVAINNAPAQVMAAMENSSYPLRKRVVWITIPRAFSSVLESTIIKIIISAALIFAWISVGYLSYELTIHFVAARALPFIINHTSIHIIRLFNMTMALIERAYRHPFRILIATFIARTVILNVPPIPYLTSFARAINPFGLFIALWSYPQTIGSFLWSTSWEIATSGWTACENAGMFLRDIAETSEAEWVANTKPRAYNLWINSLRDANLASFENEGEAPLHPCHDPLPL